MASEARDSFSLLIKNFKLSTNVGLGREVLGIIWRSPRRINRRFSELSGLSQRGRWKAASMSKNSPSESQTRIDKAGKAREISKSKKTVNHSSSRLSPKRRWPWR